MPGGGRTGHCLRQGVHAYRADLQSVGPIDTSGDRLLVRFLGCTQLYDVIIHKKFIEVKPIVDRCYWTPNKRYFLSRFNGQLEYTE